MSDSIDRFGCLMAPIAILLIVVVLAWPILQTNMDRAAADRYYAQAALSAQRQENWEHSFMMWTTALKAFEPDLLLFPTLSLLVGVAGFLLARDLARR